MGETSDEKQSQESHAPQQEPSGLVKLLSDNYFRIEQIAIALSIAAYAMKQFGMEGWAAAIGLSLTFLGVVFFIGAYRVHEIPEIFGIIFIKVSHIGASVAIIGTMFKLLRLPGASSMLGIAAMTLALTSLLLTYKWFTSSEKYRSFAMRSIIMLIISGTLFLDFGIIE